MTHPETIPPALRPFVPAEGLPLYHHAWTRQNEEESIAACLASPLLALHRSSDVNDLTADQIADAREVLRLRRRLARAAQRIQAGTSSDEIVRDAVRDAEHVRSLQRRIVERFLEGRRAHFGPDQCAPFEDARTLAEEGRDFFFVIKFMDEAAHLRATLQSLLLQQNFDPGRLVIVAVDNNSRDGSDAIVRDVLQTNRTRVRILSINQRTPGGGSTARFGVDRTIATVYQMCLLDGNWDRLQTVAIAVSDGDTIYPPQLLAACDEILTRDPTVDGVMPFLTYKLSAALRLFRDHPLAPPDASRQLDPSLVTHVPIDLGHPDARSRLPWQRRTRLDAETLEVWLDDTTPIQIPLSCVDSCNRRYAVLQGRDGHRAHLHEDGTLVLESVPAFGPEDTLVALANGVIRPDQKWRWHALIGHDLCLYWAFAGMGLPTEMVYPDTSDAAKTFRAWAFAIGGQHQLTRPDLPIVTGTDYQSGRILQAIGCTIRFGPSEASAETEIDRLAKMFWNFTHRQSVFYGETRASYLERASGLYLHMTRIQGAVETTVAAYPDAFFREVGFPERVLFPLRWLLQNTIRFYAHPEPEAQEVVRQRVLPTLFGDEAAAVEQGWLHAENVRAIRDLEFAQKQEFAEQLAEDLIRNRYPALMRFYVAALRSYFLAQRLPSHAFEWLLDEVEISRNALLQARSRVHASVVWESPEYVIDRMRGQVVALNPAEEP